MKKILLVLSLIVSAGSASAQWHHHNHHYHGGYRGGWVAPALIGGIIGYELSRPRPVVIEQQPVIVQNPPVVYQSREYCTAWMETQNPDGTVTRTRTCQQ